MCDQLTNEHAQAIREVIRRAKVLNEWLRERVSSRMEASDLSAGLPAPCLLDDREVTFEQHIDGLDQEIQVSLLATFRHGRDIPQPGTYPSLRREAADDLDLLGSYLRSSALLEESLDRGLRALGH